MSKDHILNTAAILYPQWQGAGYAPELYDGTIALWNHFSSKTPDVAIPVSRQTELNEQNGIIGFAQIKEQLLNAHSMLQGLNTARFVTIGGGCDVEVAVVSCLRAMHGPLGILWFDAHGDLNMPESSPSHLFHGMALRFLLEGGSGYGFQLPISSILPGDVALLGVRDLDPPEKNYIEKMDITVVPVNELKKGLPEELISHFSPYKKIYIHIDLDVLDPVEFAGVKCPTANGLGIKQLSSILKDIMERWDVIGLSLVENIETDVKSLGVLEPIIKLARDL